MGIPVEDKEIIELKSVRNLEDIHYRQLRTDLKLADKKPGLPVNFNTHHIIDGLSGWLIICDFSGSYYSIYICPQIGRLSRKKHLQYRSESPYQIYSLSVRRYCRVLNSS